MITVLSNIVEFTASLVEIFILYDIFQILMSDNKGLKKTKLNWLIMLIALLLVQMLNSITLFSFATIIIIVLYWSISAKYLYSIEYITALSIVGFYAVATVIFDFFMFSAVGAFWGGHDTFLSIIETTGQARMLVVIATKLLWAAGYFAIRKHLAKFQFNKYSRNFFIKVSVVGCIACLILAKFTFDAFPYAINQAWFLIVGILVCLLFYHSYVVNSRTNKAQLEMIELRNQLLEDNYETLNDIYTSNAKLYHDLNNHLGTLYQLLDTDKLSEAKEYIERISEPIKNLNSVIWTGIDVVDVILNSKIEKAQKLNVDLIYNVEFPANSNIQPHDICVILSNLIDNAIEAVAKGDNSKEVKVTMRKINNFLTIQVVNAIFEPVRLKGGKIVTTKSDMLLHGWGMQSVTAAAENYEGSVKYTFDNEQFVVTVMLFY